MSLLIKGKQHEEKKSSRGGGCRVERGEEKELNKMGEKLRYY
jgi:hypothetical protein